MDHKMSNELLQSWEELVAAKLFSPSSLLYDFLYLQRLHGIWSLLLWQ
jgi:hypothetical protein